MKYFSHVILLIVLFSCNDSHHGIEDRKTIQEIEAELLSLVGEFMESICYEREDGFETFESVISPSNKELLAKHSPYQSKGVDEILLEIHTGMVEDMAEMRNDLESSNINFLEEVGGVVDKIIYSDTLVFIVQTDLRMEGEGRRLIDTDYIICVSLDYGSNWYFYTASEKYYAGLLLEDLGRKIGDEVIEVMKSYEPSQKVEKYEE